jgi:hypothetical protein
MEVVGPRSAGKRSISRRLTAKRAGVLTATITAKQLRRLVTRGKRSTITISVTYTPVGGRAAPPARGACAWSVTRRIVTIRPL